MKIISKSEAAEISGGLDLSGEEESSNVIDLRGTQKNGWVDANGTCWAPGSSSSTMYPNFGEDGDG
ncbi:MULTISPECIES: hypothetical protein [unclassified Burkholderia]|uniref:hypothetical protein n=1 Tax=unclassified Burkholderia TaxID=2613784 RepID=UPI000F5AC9F4|nr:MULTISPECIES: hypothetical protein [unclassified Burkholderia]